MKILVLIALLLSASGASSKTLNQIFTNTAFRVQYNSCVEVACNYTNDCSFRSNLEEYARACRDVDGQCVSALCNHRGCNFKSEVLATIHSCQDVDAACVQQGCLYDHCTFQSDRDEVTQACRGYVDTECLRSLCNHAGDCSFLSRFVDSARACSAR